MNQAAIRLLAIADDAARFADDEVIAAVDAGLEADLDSVARRDDKVCLTTCSFGQGAKEVSAASLLARDEKTGKTSRRVLTVWWEPKATRVVRH